MRPVLPYPCGRGGKQGLLQAVDGWVGATGESLAVWGKLSLALFKYRKLFLNVKVILIPSPGVTLVCNSIASFLE